MAATTSRARIGCIWPHVSAIQPAGDMAGTSTTCSMGRFILGLGTGFLRADLRVWLTSTQRRPAVHTSSHRVPSLRTG